MNRWMRAAMLGLFTMGSACAAGDDLVLDEETTYEDEESAVIDEAIATAKVVTTDGCKNTLSFENELIVYDPRIIDAAPFQGAGAWSFGGLVSQLVGAEAPSVIRKWLGTWEGNETFKPAGGAEELIPGNRKNVRDMILDGWKTTNGALVMSDAPFRLLAVVYRPDLDDLAKGGTSPGEVRLIFGGMARGNRKLPIPMTVAFELRVPATTAAQAAAFAKKWHAALGPLATTNSDAGRAQLRAALVALLGEVIKPGPSSLAQLRTNEVAIDTPWDLREFRLTGAPGSFALSMSATPGVPKMALNGSAELGGIVAGFADYVKAYAGSKVPKSKETAMARIPMQEWKWTVPGASEKDRHAFAMSTCNGCHSAETKTQFVQIVPRSDGQRAELSAFLRSTKEKPLTVDGHTFTVQDDRLESFNAHLKAAGQCAP